MKRRAPSAAKCESPIEARLYRYLVDALPRDCTVTPQVPIGPYRADFVVSLGLARVVVEADGKQWHTSPDAKKYDRQRDEYMTRKGYRVIRFTGSEINTGAKDCAVIVRDAVIGESSTINEGRKAKIAARVAKKAARKLLNAQRTRLARIAKARTAAGHAPRDGASSVMVLPLPTKPRPLDADSALKRASMLSL